MENLRRDGMVPVQKSDLNSWCNFLCRHGCTVVIASRNLTTLQTAASRLTRTTGGTCHVEQLDVRKVQKLHAGLHEFRVVESCVACVKCPLQAFFFFFFAFSAAGC